MTTAFLAAAILGMAATATGYAGDSATGTGTGTVIAEVVGFPSDQGQAVVCLFTQSQWSLPPDPSGSGWTVIAEIENLAATATIDCLPQGEYVVMAFHDLDSDGQLDIDEELVGFSGELPQMSSGGGPPSFQAMSIEIAGTPRVTRIALHELPGPENMNGPPSGDGRPGGGPGGGWPGAGF